jgi:chromosome segregation ATPase
MNTVLNIVNFLGVIGLAVLCTAQWVANSSQGGQIDRLEKVRAQQEAKLANDDKTIKGDAADMDDFRTRLSASESSLKDSQDKLAKAEAENARSSGEATALKAELDKFQQAVAARDATIKEAGERMQTLVDRIQKAQEERNDAVTKFNELAVRYNAAVQQASAPKP